MSDFEGSRGEFLHLLAELGEQPAFIRRANAVTESTAELQRQVQATYRDLLKWPRIRLTDLVYRVGRDWTKCDRHLVETTELPAIRSLAMAWKSADDAVTERYWSIGGALRAFAESAERFNRCWRHAVAQFDVDHVNDVRRAYNLCYPTEKDCAFGSEIAGWTFTPIDLFQRDEILAKYPMLPVPRVRGR